MTDKGLDASNEKALLNRMALVGHMLIHPRSLEIFREHLDIIGGKPSKLKEARRHAYSDLMTASYTIKLESNNDLKETWEEVADANPENGVFTDVDQMKSYFLSVMTRWQIASQRIKKFPPTSGRSDGRPYTTAYLESVFGNISRQKNKGLIYCFLLWKGQDMSLQENFFSSLEGLEKSPPTDDLQLFRTTEQASSSPSPIEAVDTGLTCSRRKRHKLSGEMGHQSPAIQQLPSIIFETNSLKILTTARELEEQRLKACIDSSFFSSLTATGQKKIMEKYTSLQDIASAII